ncbi:MAG: outer membrane protein transport protein [Mariprofundaceae bacterium]|nr:outer membrane protein transport protein [Mariprofundaceae bacterium]
MRRILMAVFAFGFAAAQAQAAGFQIPEMGVKAMGMGHAFTAVADDPTANWFNPAGLAFQQGHAVTVGGVVIMPKVDFASNTSNPLPSFTSSADKKTLFVPHTYIAGTSDELGFSYGIGINAPFGLEMEWPTTPAGFTAAAQYGRLQAVNVNPNVAIKVSDELALALGLSYVNMYKVDFNGTALIQNFTGDGWGFNAAVLYKSGQFNFGVSYRSEVKIKSSGISTLTAAGATVNNSITVTMPDMLNVGVAFHPSERWTVSADADWVNWKKFKELAFTYNPALPVYGTSLTVPENWRATWAFRLGAEWAYTDTMRARFGYTYDPTPIKDADFTPLLPGNDRQALHIGYGVDVSDRATLDLAYTYVLVATRNQTASTGTNIVRNGSYKSDVHLAAASLTYHF